MTIPNRVVVTGVGVVSPVGLDADSTWKNLLAGKSGVDQITAFDADGTLWCAGNNQLGQTGTGDPGAAVVDATPTVGLEGSPVWQVSSGPTPTCVLLTSGLMSCAGGGPGLTPAS